MRSLSSVLRREMVSMMSLCAATSAKREGRYFSTHIWFFFASSAALIGALPLSAFRFSPTWGSLSTSISTESVIAPFAGSCRARRVPTRRCASRDENAPLASRLASREDASARACVRSPSPVRDRDCGASEPRATRGAYDRRFSRNAVGWAPIITVGRAICDFFFQVLNAFYTTVRGEGLSRESYSHRVPTYDTARTRNTHHRRDASRHELIQS